MRLEFAYVEIDGLPGGSQSLVRFANTVSNSIPAQDIRKSLTFLLVDPPPDYPVIMSRPVGNGKVAVITLRLGLRIGTGWLVVGSRNGDFPTDSERLLLGTAVNQATMGLEESRLRSELRRSSEDLKQIVAERTEELTLANAKLTELTDQLERENIVLREEVNAVSMFEEIVGSSPALNALLHRVAKVAPTTATVLIAGETGTGKELIARAIHKRSARANQPFVSVNCAAIPQSLIGSELFGHERGAFTGASQQRIGRFELAQGGTLFLDEVGELPIETQISLLRVLQENEFERVGGTRAIRSDVRVISATNRDLSTAIADGNFRSDLFYRLNVFPLDVPPLRDRKEDIPILAEYFIRRYASRLRRKVSRIDRKTLDRFQSYEWPGNIRELQNIIERSLIVCEAECFSVDESWLSSDQRPSKKFVEPLAQKLASDEKGLIEVALSQARGRVSGPLGAAARLGMPASTLESKIRALGINKFHFKSAPVVFDKPSLPIDSGE